MTPKQALEKSLSVWEWLALNPMMEKFDAYEKLGLSRDSAHCACCEYDHSQADDCSACPLYPGDTGSECMFQGAPYQRWEYKKDPYERQRAARDMVELINKRLKENAK
jgi:hypothetical protein